jgi:hypothetical protein
MIVDRVSAALTTHPLLIRWALARLTNVFFFDFTIFNRFETLPFGRDQFLVGMNLLINGSTEKRRSLPRVDPAEGGNEREVLTR